MTALRLFGPFFLLAAAASAAAVQALPGALRSGATLGLCLAVGAGALTLVAMAFARSRPLSVALGVITFGFLLRGALLGGGLWFTGRAGGSMLACAAAFLGFFAVGQLLEIAMMSEKLRPSAQEGQA